MILIPCPYDTNTHSMIDWPSSCSFQADSIMVFVSSACMVVTKGMVSNRDTGSIYLTPYPQLVGHNKASQRIKLYNCYINI